MAKEPNSKAAQGSKQDDPLVTDPNEVQRLLMQMRRDMDKQAVTEFDDPVPVDPKVFGQKPEAQN